MSLMAKEISEIKAQKSGEELKEELKVASKSIRSHLLT